MDFVRYVPKIGLREEVGLERLLNYWGQVLLAQGPYMKTAVVYRGARGQIGYPTTTVDDCGVPSSWRENQSLEAGGLKVS